jgi:hypothetical protein
MDFLEEGESPGVRIAWVISQGVKLGGLDQVDESCELQTRDHRKSWGQVPWHILKKILFGIN